ncbi:acyltransferase [Wenyingzhuangia sp. 2_MG-2023]|uniref:acyltransferase family protein n=1 Tax=Wenyingzhuangia sp. 2_MG-2023 TaxID=3062639 RepID=UPI0026E1E8F0|nr:acyltransferase [Wenyingzhuangia sp. 2_MG-2023]MDO6739307.1 acyltransferase [Wenyingzhuangia sp. 2_MG-2023]
MTKVYFSHGFILQYSFGRGVSAEIKIKRIFMLKPGLVRFILASLVVLFHVTKNVFVGGMAVFCFFILSGYWVALMYEKKYKKCQKSLFVFYASRLLRLAPVFYLLSLLNFIMIYYYKKELLTKIDLLETKGVLYTLSNVFLIGYNQLKIQPLVPAWSLDIEMQFYLLVPFLLVIMNSKIKRIACLLFSFLLMLVLVYYFEDTFISKTVLKYLVYFLIGIAIYKSKIKFKVRTEMIFNIVFFTILGLHYIIPDVFHLVKTTENSYNEYFNIAISFLLIPFLANSVLKKSDERDALLGGMSYTLYLSHWMFMIPYNYYIDGI